MFGEVVSDVHVSLSQEGRQAPVELDQGLDALRQLSESRGRAHSYGYPLIRRVPLLPHSSRLRCLIASGNAGFTTFFQNPFALPLREESTPYSGLAFS